jgi:hypothetical protein
MRNNPGFTLYVALYYSSQSDLALAKKRHAIFSNRLVAAGIDRDRVRISFIKNSKDKEHILLSNTQFEGVNIR